MQAPSLFLKPWVCAPSSVHHLLFHNASSNANFYTRCSIWRPTIRENVRFQTRHEWRGTFMFGEQSATWNYPRSTTTYKELTWHLYLHLLRTSPSRATEISSLRRAVRLRSDSYEVRATTVKGIITRSWGFSDWTTQDKSTWIRWATRLISYVYSFQIPLASSLVCTNVRWLIPRQRSIRTEFQLRP
jgi:hypothetical protein